MTVESSNNQADGGHLGVFSLEKARLAGVSTLNDPGWRLLLQVVVACVAAAVVSWVWGAESGLAVWGTCLLTIFATLAAIRFLLLDIAWRRFWIVWLSAGALALLVSGSNSAGMIIAISMWSVFLVFRRYRPYRHLTSRRRAGAFFLGFLAFAVMATGLSLDTDGVEAAGLHKQGISVLLSTVVFLQVFWVISLLKLFFGMRLHFMRLKPKLAMSVLFLAVVPLVLIVTFGLLALYGGLGTGRATRAKAVVQDWSRWAPAAAIPSGAIVAYPDADPSTAPPDWLPRFVDALMASAALSPEELAAERERARAESAAPDTTGDETSDSIPLLWAPRDTTALFHVGPELWLLALRGVGSPDLRINGFCLDETALDHLSAVMGADAELTVGPQVSIGDPEEVEARSALRDSSFEAAHVRGRVHEDTASADSAGGVWQRRMAFGASILPILRVSNERFYHDDALLHLHIRLADLGTEFFRGERNVNLAIVIILAILAGLFLIVELGALFLGIRITGGITSAVRLLHEGTKRLASGDMTTRIAIPNEDEFGDLALSFNEMALAVERGREEAVARERLERELATAREIQERLLPHEMPVVPGFEVTATSVPSLQVGGDYYDFLAQGDGRCGIAIGDVSGKGMPAALLMSNLQASLQGQVIHPSSVGEVVGRVNELLVRSTDPHMFATFFYGVLDCNDATFTSTNAGHNPPLLCHLNGEIELLDTGGLVLGMLPGQTYEQMTVTMSPGDVVVLFTDGITEAAGPRSPGDEDAGDVDRDRERGAETSAAADTDEEPDDMFGDDALMEVVRTSVGRAAVEIKEAILSAVERHTAGTPQSDDITLVVVKRRED